MTVVNCDGNYLANFVFKGNTYSSALPRNSADEVGTTDKPTYLYDGYNNPTDYSTYYTGIIGQGVRKLNNVVEYRTIISEFRFDIPVAPNSVKSLNSVALHLGLSRINNATFSNPVSPKKINIYLIDQIKPYSIADLASLTPINTFQNDVGSQVIYFDVSKMIPTYSLKLLMVYDEQVKGLGEVPLSGSNTSYIDVTRIYFDSYLSVDYTSAITNNAIDTIGFKHYDYKNSGFVEYSPYGGSNLILQNSGFQRLQAQESSGSVIFHPSSGHQIRNYDIICQDTCLRFASANATRKITLKPSSTHPGVGAITVYQWKQNPKFNYYNWANQTQLGTIPQAGGNFTLNVLPGQNWFHFMQSSPQDGGQQKALRISEVNGILIANGFR